MISCTICRFTRCLTARRIPESRVHHLVHAQRQRVLPVLHQGKRRHRAGSAGAGSTGSVGSADPPRRCGRWHRCCRTREVFWARMRPRGVAPGGPRAATSTSRLTVLSGRTIRCSLHQAGKLASSACSTSISCNLPAELITLSGCGTGLNVVVGGDELMGLKRGLLYAGRAGMLLTLWDVNDQSTAEFMWLFYERLRGGSHQGQGHAVRHRRDPADAPHPFYWSPFVPGWQPRLVSSTSIPRQSSSSKKPRSLYFPALPATPYVRKDTSMLDHDPISRTGGRPGQALRN